MTQFVCFGFRDYDPATQRFITRDPLGFADGFNPYAYVLNNPISYSDVYGLKARYGACTCHPDCAYHTDGKCGHDGGELLPDDEEKKTPEQEEGFWPAAEKFTTQLLDEVDRVSTAMVCVPYAPVMGAGAFIKGSLYGGRGVVWLSGKAALYLKAIPWSKITPIAKRSYRWIKDSSKNAITKLFQRITPSKKKVAELNRFNKAAQDLSEKGQQRIRDLRKWAKSKGWKCQPNPEGGPEKWGRYSNEEFEWNLIIKPEKSCRPGLHPGSDIPRFDARLFRDKKGRSYINPFTGEIGDHSIGTHLNLDPK